MQYMILITLQLWWFEPWDVHHHYSLSPMTKEDCEASAARLNAGATRAGFNHGGIGAGNVVYSCVPYNKDAQND